VVCEKSWTWFDYRAFYFWTHSIQLVVLYRHNRVESREWNLNIRSTSAVHDRTCLREVELTHLCITWQKWLSLLVGECIGTIFIPMSF